MNAPNAQVLSVRSLRGTQREYELVLIVRPDFNKTTILELVEKLQRIFAKEGGALLKVENWGLRTLAYPIRRNKRGIYLYTRFLGGSATVSELERNLRLDEGVIRYLTVKIDEDVDPEARPSELNEDVLAAAGETAPDPVEVARKLAEEEAARQAAEAEAEAAARAAEAESERARAESARSADDQANKSDDQGTEGEES